MDVGMEDAQHPPGMSDHGLMQSPLKKTRSIFTASNQIPNAHLYSPNSVPIIPNGTALRTVQFAPLPRFVGPPRFPNSPQYINRGPYPIVHGMVSVFPSTTTTPPTLSPQPQLPPSSESQQVNYDHLQHQLQQQQPPPTHYVGARFPNPAYLNRTLYPVVHGMVPMFPFASTAPPQQSHQPSSSESQFAYNQIQKMAQPPQFSLSPDQILSFDQENSNIKTAEEGAIILGEELHQDCQSTDHLDIQVFKDNVFTSLEPELEYVPNEDHCPALQDIAYEVEVETTSCQSKDGLGADITEDDMEHHNSSSQEYSPSTSPTQVPGARSSFKLDLDASVHEEVVRAAKALFSKRTRTLYHWLYPDKSKTKLKASVTSAWDTLPENEKHFYISQVLGRFGVQTGTLMINPQLDGIKGYTKEVLAASAKASTSKKSSCTGPLESAKVAEDKKAVEDMLAVYNDPDCWDTYSPPEQRRRKRRAGSRQDRNRGSEDEETLKRMRKGTHSVTDFEGDIELNSELEKFRLFSDNEVLLREEGEDIWQQSPKRNDLFAEFDV